MSAVTGVSLNKTTLSLDISQHETLIATVAPSDASNKTVYWNSSRTDIAEVSDTGIISPLENGTAVISVSTEEGAFTASCTVEVYTSITGISLEDINVEMGSDKTLELIYNPKKATKVTPTWSSSNNSIATVDQNGKVTPVSTGSCKITAKVVSQNGQTYTAESNVKVVIYPNSISLDKEEISQHVIGITDPETLTVVFDPDNTTEKTITWSSSNTEICTYDGSKIIYTGEVGTCYINAKDVKNHIASCKVNVFKKLNKPENPIVVDIQKTSVTLESKPSNYVFSKDNGATWQSSPVFNNLALNTTYSFIQKELGYDNYYNSDPSDPTQVTTRDIIHVQSVTLDKHNLTINSDETYDFSVTILPENAEIQDVYYTFSNPAVAMMNGTQLVPRDGGNGIVTVTSVEGGKTDTCEVTIYKKADRPTHPKISTLNTNYIIAVKEDPYQLFNLYEDGKEKTGWVSDNVIGNLNNKKTYALYTKIKAHDNVVESEVSEPTCFVLPLVEPDDWKDPGEIYLNANDLYFDMNKTKYATLAYTIAPVDASNKCVIYYSSDSDIVAINGNGEVTAKAVGEALITVETIAGGGKTAYCRCHVEEKRNRPDPPKALEITINSVLLEPVEGCEYSLDGITWRSNNLFENLANDSYYNFFQRYKQISEFVPASESSVALTVKTLPKDKPGGTSPSGYKWGQEVEVNKIPVYSSPYSRKSDFKLTGRYFIYSINESNHRIRITDIEEYIDVPGHSLGWVNIADLKLIIDEIYIGDRVIVSGNINTNADGSGISIYKNKSEMFITTIVGLYEYGYGVTDKPGKARIGFAKRDMITKYEDIIIDEN